jgi:peptidoglycan/LPS O-acetylase OafA/YrhL
MNRDSNNFGFLRLLFAALVILSHSPQLIDGNTSRELLVRVFKTVDFGEVAVDGFFLVSGYLIIASYLRSKTKIEYLLKRILRIYPGFVVACIFSYAVGWVYGRGHFTHSVHLALVRVADLIFLNPPSMAGAFPQLPYHTLNGSMWTIAYEFRCYLIVILLGVLGLFKRRRIYLLVALLVWSVALSGFDLPLPEHISAFTGNIHQDFRMAGMFFSGGVFFLYRDKIVYRGWIVAACVAALIPFLFSELLAEFALGTIGAYILFAFAFHSSAGFLSKVDNKVDLSYGIYLYAWPIQQIIICYHRNISQFLLTGMTLVIASALAYVSWTVVERPFMELKKRIPSRFKGNVTQAASGL